MSMYSILISIANFSLFIFLAVFISSIRSKENFKQFRLLVFSSFLMFVSNLLMYYENKAFETFTPYHALLTFVVYTSFVLAILLLVNSIAKLYIGHKQFKYRYIVLVSMGSGIVYALDTVYGNYFIRSNISFVGALILIGLIGYVLIQSKRRLLQVPFFYQIIVLFVLFTGKIINLYQHPNISILNPSDTDTTFALLIINVILTFYVTYLVEFGNAKNEELLETKSMIEDSLVKIKQISLTDSLTGLCNRKCYEDKILEYNHERNLPLSIVLADVNGLKLVNDAFGHQSGDELLIKVAQIFKKHVKYNNYVARIGGDEFVILMPNTSPKRADVILANILQEVKMEYVNHVEISISFGIATKELETENFFELFKQAEDAMYRMKLTTYPSMRSNTIETIIGTLYEKDHYSESHSRQVSAIAEFIAEKMKLPVQDINDTKMAGVLHDVGKIIIPVEILNKEDKLTESEYEEMKKHPQIGYRILNSAANLQRLSSIVLYHHEWWNGKGYPTGAAGESIPLQSRIISVADSFDAMVSHRKYRNNVNYEDALSELIRCSGTQFDPQIVKAVHDNFEELIENLYTGIVS